jgi:hypothetical protein
MKRFDGNFMNTPVPTFPSLSRKSVRMKRPLPVTSCTNCGAPGYSIERANRKCGRMISKKRGGGTERCKGLNRSATLEKDWGECPSCAATGDEGANRCSLCNGVGWFLIRDKREWP